MPSDGSGHDATGAGLGRVLSPKQAEGTCGEPLDDVSVTWAESVPVAQRAKTKIFRTTTRGDFMSDELASVLIRGR